MSGLPDALVRSFVALPCPPELVSVIAAERAAWRSTGADVRWVDPGSIHLTLRFLGNAGPLRLGRLDRALERTTAAAPPILLRAGATGAFPSWERPRVLWLGLVGEGPLGRLAEAIEADARAAGFDPEERPFHPHLTLGRVRSGRGIRQAVEALRPWTPEVEPEVVEEVVLYRSDLGPGGARYSALARYPLTGKEEA